MPLITDLLHKKEGSKLFQKKTYRPWDDELIMSSSQININDDSSEALASEDKNIDASKENDIDTTIAADQLKINQISCQDLEKEFRGLFGAQKIILQYVLKLIEDRLTEYVITKSISMDEFTIECNLPPNTIKTMLQKLKHKNLLETHEYKPGRGGYSRYKIPNDVYNFFTKRYS